MTIKEVTQRIKDEGKWVEITPELLEYLTNNKNQNDARKNRLQASKASFLVFLAVYYRHKLKLEPADFHNELIHILQHINDFIAVLGFRGSAKSTILEAYALWCMLNNKSKHTVYIALNDTKATQAVANIRSEIENNKLLRADYKINIEAKKMSATDKWSEKQITLFGNTIIAKSRGAKGIRGILFDGARLELIICDDLEDSENTKTAESRKKTREWFYTEVALATAQGVLASDVKIVLLGNLVHRDCLIANLDKIHLDNNNIVTVLKFPLINEDGEITWRGLYPNLEAVNIQKQIVLLAGQGLGTSIWAREYLLKFIDEEDQIIKDTDIQYYDDSWLQRPILQSGVGVDLAISQKQTADYTSMVKAIIVRNDFGERRLLVLRNPVKQRLDFVQTIQTAKNIKTEMLVNPTFYVEKVAYQQSAIELMEKNGLLVVPKPATTDKRSRLLAISPYIKSGMVLFPKDGASDILEEVIGFGIEAHDDVCDAFVHVVDGMLNTNQVLIAE